MNWLRLSQMLHCPVITIDNDTKVRISTNYKIKSNDENIDNEIMGILYKGLKSELGNMAYEDFSVSNETIGVVSTEKVGPSIAADITRGAIWAVVLSLIAMALYILLRFRDISFSVGALARSCVYRICNNRILLIVLWLPAVLNGGGPVVYCGDTYRYRLSVNDTVVVFDRCEGRTVTYIRNRIRLRHSTTH